MIRELKEENAKLRDIVKKVFRDQKEGKPINLEEYGITDVDQAIEDMNENEKLLDDFQKPWEEKLAEAKAKSGMMDTPDEEEKLTEEQHIDQQLDQKNDQFDNLASHEQP